MTEVNLTNTPQPIKQHRVKKILKYLVIVFIVFMVTLLLTGALLQTHTGKNILARQLGNLLSPVIGYEIYFDEIRGWLPFQIILHNMTLSDEEGLWFELSELYISLSPTELLRGKVHINHLGIETITLHRIPETETSEPKESFEIPDIPQVPRWLSLVELRIDTIQLGHNVMNSIGMNEESFDETVRFSLSGYLNQLDRNSNWDALLNLERLDHETTHLKMRAGMPEETLLLDLELYDAAILPSILNISEPVLLTLNGEGSGHNWDGITSLRLGDTPLVEGDISLSLLSSLDFDIELQAYLENDLFPEVLPEHLGNQVSLKLKGNLNEDLHLYLEQAELVTDQATVIAQGEINLNEKMFNTQIKLTHQDLQPYLAGIESQTEVSTFPLDVSIVTSGPLELLDVNISSFLSGDELLTGNLNLQLSDSISLSGLLHAYPAHGLLPDDIYNFLEDGIALQLALTYDTEGNIDVSQLFLEGAGLHLNVNGELHTRQPQADLHLEARVDDAHPYGILLGLPLAGALNVQGLLVGDDNGSRFNLNMHGNELAFDTNRIQKIEFSIEGKTGAWPDTLLDQWEISTKGDIQGIQVADIDFSDMTVQAMFQGEGTTTIQVDTFTLTDGNLEITSQGSWSAGDETALLETTMVIADITPWSQLIGQDVHGGLHMQTTTTSNADTLARMDINLETTEIYGLPTSVSEIIGVTPTLNAQLQFHEGILTLGSIVTELAQGRILLSGQINTDDEQLAIRTELIFPELNIVMDSNDYVRGRLDGRLELNGDFNALAVSGTINAQNFGMNAFHADNLALQVAMEGLPGQLHGRLQCEISTQEVPLVLDARLESSLPEIHVPYLSIQAPDNYIEGSLRWNIESRQGNAQLDVTMEHLSVFEAFTDFQLEGSITGNIAMQATERTSSLDGTFELKDLTTPWVAAENTTAMVRATDLFNEPEGDLLIQAGAIQINDMYWSNVEFKADGNHESVQFATSGEGKYQTLVPHRLYGTGQLQLSEGISAVLHEFEFSFDDKQYYLETPLDLKVFNGEILLKPLNMHLGGGTLAARFLQTPDSIDVDVTLRDLPLSLIQSFGLTPMKGQVQARLQVMGTPQNPQAIFSLDIESLQLTDDDVNAPPLDLHLKTRLAESLLSGTVTGNAPESLTLTGQFNIPFNISLAPFNFTIPTDSRIDGRLDSEIDLASIPLMAGIEDHVLAGTTQIWATVSGFTENPLVQGEIILSDGRYENIEAGTILEAINLLVEAKPNKIELTRFSAEDGVGGSLQGHGEFNIQPEADFPFTINIDLSRARLIHRDDVSSHADGNVLIAGSTQEINVTGDLTIGPADITLPERLPPREMVVVEVKEINRPDDWAPATGHTDTTQPFGPKINLDIRTQIPNRVFVRGPGLDSEWNGHLHILGSGDDPRIQGQLNVMRGQLDFLGRRFMFAESIITFDASTPPSPFLNVTATADAGDVVARLRMTGPFDTLQLDLESEPFLPQDEILARVMFGRNLSDITPMQAVQLARYASMFRGNVGGLGLLSAGSGRMPGLDRFDFRRGATAEESAVGLGKYLSEEVYFEFEQGLTPESTKAKVNVDLSPQIKLEGEVSAGARSGIGIFWKRDY